MKEVENQLFSFWRAMVHPWEISSPFTGHKTSSDGEGQDVPLKSFPGQCPGHHLLQDTRSFSSTELPAPMAMELGSAPASANLEECRNRFFLTGVGMGATVL